ncbi:unnamed protein product [Camellia sinensis]
MQRCYSRTNKKKRKHEEAKSIEMSSACPTVAKVKLEVDKLAEEVANLKGTSKERKAEEVKSDMLSRACAAIAKVRAEVDKLVEQMATLEAIMNGGTKVGEKDFHLFSLISMFCSCSVNKLVFSSSLPLSFSSLLLKGQKLFGEMQLNEKGSNLTTKGDEADSIDYKRGRI